MGDDITIGVTEIVNNIEVTAQPNDQIVDISVIDNADDVTLNITPTVIEINVNKGSSYAKWGTILGTLSDQTDLQNALDLKANLVGGKVPASELPSYVDDVVEVANYAALPTTGETGKIYVTLDNNKIYRWSGSVYIEIAANNAIWGAITGTLSSQTDLQSALDAKFDDPTGDTTQYIAGDGSLITFPIAGQSGTLVRQVRNTTGATLLKGTIVYINGANGNKPTVAKAIATGDSTSAQTFGMLQADISDNANGYVVCVGDIIGLDTSAITEGTQLYLSSTTAGAYTTTKQVAPAHLVYIGVVTRSHPTLGQIEVKIQNGYELDEIHDVLITSKANNQFLVYESATDLWKNKSLGTVLAGTSSQFVKGDGSLDSNSYILSVAANAPLGSTGGTSPVISITQATTSSNGYLSSTDWNTFNGKQNALTNPITGTGTTNKLLKFTGSTTISDSNITDNGTVVSISTNATINNVNIGVGSGSATGFSTTVGASALISNTTGSGNTAIGHSTLLFNTTGSNNTANGMFALKANISGNDNTSIGFNTLLSNTTGLNNTAVGSNAILAFTTGSNNTAIGYAAGGNAISSSSNNVYLGNRAGSNSFVTENNKLYIANAAGTPLIGGDFSAKTITIDGTITATSIIKTGGTSSQFLKADGSVDSTSYQPLLTNPITGSTLLSGNTGDGYITRASSSQEITNSLIYDTGTNIGIGTYTPYSATNYKFLTIDGTNGSGYVSRVNSVNSFLFYSNASGSTLSEQRALPLLFETNGSEKMRLTTNGELLIGRTSSYGAGWQLAVEGNIYAKNDLRIDANASFGGNVGIGTTSPSALLQVLGINTLTANTRYLKTQIGGAVNWGLNSFEELAVGYSGIRSIYTGGDNWDLSFAAGNSTSFTNGTQSERMRITSGGSVGIGTTSPSEKLQVNGNILAVGNIYTTDSNILNLGYNQGGGATLKYNSNGNLDITPRAGYNTIFTTGNVGIGTTSPTTTLDVVGDIRSRVANTTTARLLLNNTDTQLSVENSGGNMLFTTSGSAERMRITSGGNVLIGTTTDVSAKLNVAGSGKVASFGSIGSGNDNYISFVGTSNTFDVGVTSGSWGIADSGVAYRFKVSQSGNVYVSTLGTGLVYSNGGTLTSTNPSDSRLKDNIVSLNYGLNEILKLRPVSYNWKNDNINQGKQFGFIAQEVQEVMPELVKEFETEDGERLGLDKEGIYAALVNAIQELKAEIEILKNK